MKTIIKRYFSMVEVALAIGILAIGAVTVVTLFPVGMKQTRDSVGQNYSAIFADDAYAYISGLAKDPNEWKTGGAIASLPTTKPNTTVISSQGLSKTPGTDIMATGTPGVYVISKGSSSMQDFQAQVNIWGDKVNTPFESVVSTPSYTITSADIGMSPTGSQYEFVLTKPNGVDKFDRDSMQSLKNTNFTGEFDAINIKMRIKNGATIVVNGQNVTIGDKDITFTSPAESPMRVSIHNDQGMGKWYMKFIGGTSITVSNDDGTPIGGLPPPSIPNISKGVHIEISWPLNQTNYSLRNKLKYYFEVYNMSIPWH